MAFITRFLIGDLAIIVVIVLCLLYWWQTKNFNYWKVRGVPYFEPNWFFGNITDPMLKRVTWMEFCCRNYEAFKSNGFGGLYLLRKPAIMICDSRLIEKVLVEDFSYFEDRWDLVNHEKLTNSLYFATGEKWRRMRLRIHSAFSSMKVKGMFEQILKCCDCICEQIDECIQERKSIDMESLLFIYSTEVVASCAFGVHILTDSLEGQMFRKAIGNVFTSSTVLTSKKFLALQLPRLARLFGVNTIHDEVTSFFMNFTKSTIEHRKKNHVRRNDFLQILLTLMEQEKKDMKSNSVNMHNDSKFSTSRTKNSSDSELFTEECIASVIYNCLTLGTEPSVTVNSFCLFEIARNCKIQKRLQEEIDSSLVKHHGWNFEATKEMTYLDQVIQETLRLYNYKPLMRTANRSYKLPGTNVTLEKGMLVFIPLAAIHLDPQYYQSPKEFNPDRFEGNNFKPTPFFLPFGYGPRICINIKFAVTIMKVFIARIISKYTVAISSKMHLPLRLDRNVFSSKAEGGIWLSFHKREIGDKWTDFEDHTS